jgi:hypothetical protein
MIHGAITIRSLADIGLVLCSCSAAVRHSMLCIISSPGGFARSVKLSWWWRGGESADAEGRRDGGHRAVGRSGAEAIAMAAGSSPDLVILDLGLSDVAGETVARNCARRRRRPS